MAGQKKVLIISPIPFLPLLQGNRSRLLTVMEMLRRQNWEISFIFVRTETDGDESAMASYLTGRLWVLPFDRANLDPRRSPRVSPVGRLCAAALDRLIALPERLAPLEKAARLLLDPLYLLLGDRLYSFGIDELYPPSLDSLISELSGQVSYDAILIEYAYLSRAFLSFPAAVRKVLDTHDLFSFRHRIFVRNGIHPGGFSTVPAEERKAFERSDVILAIQQNEAARFRTMTTKRVVTLTHAIEPKPAPAGHSDSPELLFVGSGNICNERGLKAFLSHVFVPLRRKIPELRLLLAGAICDRLTRYEGVEKLGHLKTLDSAYARAGVIVNPIEFGTGLKIKTIEALAYQKPLVTTAHAASGIEEWAGRSFLVANDWSEFRKHIEDLLRDPSLRKRLRQGALEFTESNRQLAEEAVGKAFGDAPVP